ncbi:hypothetical protein PVK06_035383 [Gossypium arboreum]|uniref:Uncharacterized protein n=1 Tax=Gossypium arboreum TaxID=29729 RepID=A0ABR0NH78_GOSAR|nr:hypothetical protein PVK06_035383 [Gossypium arboreum]
MSLFCGGVVGPQMKSEVKQELERRGVQELSKAMIMVESLIEFVSRKDKIESSKPKEKCNGRRRSALVDMTTSNLFISEKVMSKLGLSVSKSTKKINMINALLVPFVDFICILHTQQQQFVVPVSRDMRDRTKVLPVIQLAKDVSCGGNNDLVDRNATKTPLKMLEVQKTDAKPIEVSVGLPPMREVGCASDLGEK